MSLKEEVNACAVVVDNHTGKVRAQFQGIGAEHDARSFLRQCQGPKGGDKVDFLSSASVITGDRARKVLKQGRV